MDVCKKKFWIITRRLEYFYRCLYVNEYKTKQMILENLRNRQTSRTMKPSNILVLLSHFGFLWGTSIPSQKYNWERAHFMVEDAVCQDITPPRTTTCPALIYLIHFS